MKKGISSTLLLCASLWLTAGTPTTLAQCTLDANGELTSPDANPGDRYGLSVAIHGDIAVVGAPNDSADAETNGAAYVFRFQNSAWQQVARLTASDPSYQSHFGNAVALNADSILIGAYGENAMTGAVYVFREQDGTWQQTQKLVAADGEVFDAFGVSIAISGDTAIIGAEGDRAAGWQGGAVYFLHDNNGTWEGAEKRIGTFTGASSQFGHSVAIDGDFAVVGQNSSIGFATVFQRTNGVWTESALIDPPAAPPSRFDAFGVSVAISGDTILVGSPGENFDVDYIGRVFVYKHIQDTWQLEAVLADSQTTNNDRLGESVALSGDLAIAGAPYPPATSEGSGLVLAFRRVDGVWHPIQRIEPDVPGVLRWGISTAIDANRFVIGAESFLSGSEPPESPSPLVLQLSGNITDCNANGISDDCDIAAQLSTDCNANMIPDDCEPLGTIADFVNALLSASSDPFDVCVFDGDDNGVLDGLDVQPFVTRLISD